ncbi:hypothetical protein PRIPAC_81661 [Pristionchus pacificus]|uniref:Uncharacterized protein n=1 Tax=Pristionchus pacificus TaxID=54126 RepID=A0A2A6CP95_PRIPA|nr:hypothetical protein PRIPAC_81661 [Pristionchus pacificus]|eukprot:PDM79897.1 hypothetical protein PRIPAC_32476 [Pristionchus pacificus]
MFHLLLLSTVLFLGQVRVSCSVECRKCTESVLLPGIKGCNDTCSGEYCYRAEYNISALFREQEDEHAMIMDCFDFPLEQLKLGCRRNFEGIVLCVCQSDLCNDSDPTNIVDLAIVDDCVYWYEDEGYVNELSKPIACRSHFCFRRRNAVFDLFVRPYFSFFIPVGMCVKTQSQSHMVLEICSCPYAVCERIGQIRKSLAQFKNVNSLKLCVLGFSRVLMTMGRLILPMVASLAPDDVTSKSDATLDIKKQGGKLATAAVNIEDRKRIIASLDKTPG